jgi:2-polyprenyl-6-methoxyphenol hydroxylase-like FAD-dependent oxidoreductase
VGRWYKPGLLLIGDAAHVMSPVAGVGINVAVQDAIAAANLLTGPLRRGAVTTRDLAAVQKQRESAVRLVQRIQRAIQDRLAAPGLDAGHEFRPPWWLWPLTSIPELRDIPARMLAFGPGRVRLRDLPPPP